MYVSVRVLAGAKRERIEAEGKGRLLVAVKEPAERNLANRRVLAVVAAHFKVPAKRVRLVSGHHSPSKILDVEVGE